MKIIIAGYIINTKLYLLRHYEANRINDLPDVINVFKEISKFCTKYMEGKVKRMYAWDTVYVVGESRTNMDNAITSIYNSFYIGFEVNIRTNEIVDVGCTHTMSITEKFIKSIFCGKHLDQYYNDIEEEIKLRYYGTSQKAVIVSYKDAFRKYIDLKQRYGN